MVLVSDSSGLPKRVGQLTIEVLRGPLGWITRGVFAGLDTSNSQNRNHIYMNISNRKVPNSSYQSRGVAI